MPTPPDEQRSFARPFLVLGLLLSAASAWAIYDEVVTRRPWKPWQADFVERVPEDGRAVAVSQVVVPQLDLIDRCTTCHAGIDDPRLVGDDVPAVLRAHPRREELLGTHPVGRFGCTSCHRGQGLALTEDEAHGLDSEWPDPMLPAGYEEASCLACHPDALELAGAPKLMAGRQIYQDLGCGGCHAEALSQGPSLLHVASKLPPGELLAWLKDPQVRRSGPRMPVFWPGADTDPAMSERRDTESLAIAAYLLAKSEPYEAALLAPEPDAGLVDRGQELFDAVGCRGCHELSEEGDAPLEIREGGAAQAAADDVWASFGGGDFGGDLGGDDGAEAGGDAGGGEDFAAGFGSGFGDDLPEEEQAPAGPTDDFAAGFGGGFGDSLEEEPAPEPRELWAQVPPQSHPREGAIRFGPPLGRSGARLLPAFVHAWLTDPVGYWADALMPSFGLPADDTLALTSFLADQGPGERAADPPELQGELDPELVQEGADLIGAYGCAGCHEIPGFESEAPNGADLSDYGRKPLTELFFGDALDPGETPSWERYTRTKLEEPRAFATEDIEQLMPDFALDETQVDALLVYLRAQRGEGPTGYVFRDELGSQAAQGGEVFRRRNCTGCHTWNELDGDIMRHYVDVFLGPPPLTGIGRKLQPQWMVGFLRHPTPLRPWLQARMPDFRLSSEDSIAVVAWLVREAGLDELLRDVPIRPVDSQRAELGQAMFEEMKCVSCHKLNNADGKETAELAPDMGLARQRLDPRWMRDFLDDPGRLIPRTRMPQFFPEGISPMPEILDGSVDAQSELLVDHLMNLGVQPVEGAAMVKGSGSTPRREAP